MQKKRVNSTRWKRGKTSENIFAQYGMPDTGKKVPENRNIGVMNRKIGRLNISMVGVMLVKSMPMEANASPPRNASGIHSSAVGKFAYPRGMRMVSIKTTAAMALEAAQEISATMISSTLNGVARMPANVFW